MSNILTVQHSGKLGDLIYSLPIVRHLNANLVINPNIYITKEIALDLCDMLRNFCKWLNVDIKTNQKIDFDLDEFRTYATDDNKLHLIKCHELALNIENVNIHPWINCEEKKFIAPIVINRTMRNINKNFPWELIKNKNCVFLGLKEEYEKFPIKIPYFPTNNITDLVQVISGAECVICNQSFVWTIAEAMDKKRCLEVNYLHPCAMPITKNGVFDKLGLLEVLKNY